MIADTGKTYLLRWRYDFVTGAIYGMWNSSAITAWDRNKPGLKTACIEAKDVQTEKITRVAECEGHDFRNFQWIAVARVNPNLRGSVTPRSELIGLKILTTNEEVSVLVNGQGARRALTPAEKGLQFATYGR